MTPLQERLLSADLRVPRGSMERYYRPCGEPFDPSLVPSLDGVVATVGDVTSAVVMAGGAVPRLSVFDGRTSMLPLGSFGRMVEGLPRRVAECPFRMLTADLSRAVRDGLSGEGQSLVEVVGEEDMAVLAAVAFAPDGASVMYGTRRDGLMRIEAGEASRAAVEALVERMDARRHTFIYSQRPLIMYGRLPRRP